MVTSFSYFHAIIMVYKRKFFVLPYKVVHFFYAREANSTVFSPSMVKDAPGRCKIDLRRSFPSHPRIDNGFNIVFREQGTSRGRSLLHFRDLIGINASIEVPIQVLLTRTDDMMVSGSMGKTSLGLRFAFGVVNGAFPRCMGALNRIRIG